MKADLLFENGIHFSGSWNFNAKEAADACIITGNTGSITFPVFGKHEMIIDKGGKKETITFDIPAHVQQPMIEQTVRYFLGQQDNPCSAEEGCEVMRLMEEISR